MRFHPLAVLQGFFGHIQTREGRAGMAGAGKLWREAFDRMPDLRADLIAQGGLLRPQAVTMIDGVPDLVPPDPHVLAYEAGRRDLAIQLLAAGGITIDDLNQLLEDQRYDP